MRSKAGATGGKIQVVKKRKGGRAKLFWVVHLWCFGFALAGGGISHKICYATLQFMLMKHNNHSFLSYRTNFLNKVAVQAPTIVTPKIISKPDNIFPKYPSGVISP